MSVNTFPLAGLPAAVLLLSPLSMAADAGGSRDYQFSANATIASDYIFRGVSQTMEDPAVQAGFDFSHDLGLYAGVWSSNVDFQDRGPNDDQADQEIDLYLGYGAAVNEDWSVDVSFVRYIYPGTASDRDLDYNELLASVSYRDFLSAMIGYSNDVFNSDEDGIYYNVATSVPLQNNFQFTASVGYYDLDDAADDSYMDWSIGIEYSSGAFTTRLAYIDTDSSGEDLYGDNAEARAVLSISAAFGK